MRRHWHRHTHECPTIIAYFVFAMSHTGPHDANKYTTKLTNKSEQQLFCSHLNDSKQRKKVAKNRRNDMIISAMLPFLISFHSISFEFTRFYIFTARTELLSLDMKYRYDFGSQCTCIQRCMYSGDDASLPI